MRRAPFCAGLLLAFGFAPLRAQDGPGTEGALLFQLSPAPRAVALGDAYAALSGGLALFHNPAGLAGAPTSVSLAYQTLPTDASAGLAFSAFRLGPGAFAMGLQFLDYGSIDEVKPDASGLLGVPTGVKVSGGEVAASLGYGVQLGWFRLGAAARVLRVDIAEVSANTAVFDAGVAANLLGRRVMIAGARGATPADGPRGPGRSRAAGARPAWDSDIRADQPAFRSGRARPRDRRRGRGARGTLEGRVVPGTWWVSTEGELGRRRKRPGRGRRHPPGIAAPGLRLPTDGSAWRYTPLRPDVYPETLTARLIRTISRLPPLPPPPVLLLLRTSG
jgi:hypothetical protein